MSNKIVNSAAADSYFEIDGTATTSSTQPEVNKGAASLLGSNNDLLNNANVISDVEATGAGSNISVSNKINTIDVEEAFTNTVKTNVARALRTVKTSEGIRNDKWNTYDASWDSGYPETGNDATAIGLADDDAYVVRTFVFGDGIIPDEKVI